MRITVELKDSLIEALRRVYTKKSPEEIVGLAVEGLWASTEWYHGEQDADLVKQTPYMDLTPHDVALQQLRDLITFGDDDEYKHIRQKALDAAYGGYDAWSVQSKGERLAVALVLDRVDWLSEMDYTIAEALERIGPRWSAAICSVAREIRKQLDE